MLNRSLQKQAQLLLCGGCLATKDLVGLGYAGEDVENEGKEITLGVGGAVIEGLGKVHRGCDAPMTREAFHVSGRAPPREGVAFEQNIQKLTHHQHRRFCRVSIFGVLLESYLFKRKKKIEIERCSS